MEKCFITKLPSSVDNDGIVRLGEIPLYFDVDESPNYKNREFTISMYSQPERTLRIYNGYFTDKTLTQNLGTTLTLPATGASNFNQTFYVSNTKCTVFIPIRYTDHLDVLGQTSIAESFIPNTKYIDLEDIRYTNAGSILLDNSNRLDWDIAKVAKYFPNIGRFKVANTNCFGDISAFSNLVNLTFLELSNTKVSGDISAFSNLVNLTSLGLNGTKVSGDISVFSNLTKLNMLILSDTKVSGDISVFSNLTKLNMLMLNGTKVSGDISAFSNLVNLTTMRLYNNTNITGDISSLSKLVNLDTLMISNTNIAGDISVIIDNMPKIKNLYISAKIAATDAQIKTLQDRGVTILRW